MQAVSPLPEHYYLHNFCELLQGVAKQYADYLPFDIVNFLSKFNALENDSQCLLVRLLARKGAYFRLSKLHYPELTSLSAAADGLCAGQLANHSSPEQAAQWLSLYTKAEWVSKINRGLLPEPDGGTAGWSRPQLDAYLLQCLPELSVQQAAELAEERILHIVTKPVFDWLKLLYFGNAHQDLSEFVLRDLALSRFEAYTLGDRTRLFRDWLQVTGHMQVYLADAALAALDPADSNNLRAVLESLPACNGDDWRLRRKLDRLRLAVARQLERNGEFAPALELYRQAITPPARERRARVLVQLGLPLQALALCREIAAQPINDDEADFAAGFGYRTARKQALAYWPKVSPYEPPTEHWTLPWQPGEWGARQPEWAVANALARSGDCHYVENHLFLAVFALVYWPVYFAPVAGAFSHPFQSQPHDLYDPEFLASRTEQLRPIDDALAGASEHLPQAELLARFHAKRGTNHSLIYWPALSEELLLTALHCIPLADWRAIFRYLWGDLRERRRGLPDLIHFPTAGGYELIEVKGPGDKLQVHQRRWLGFFSQQGIAHRVVNLAWQR